MRFDKTKTIALLRKNLPFLYHCLTQLEKNNLKLNYFKIYRQLGTKQEIYSMPLKDYKTSCEPLCRGEVIINFNDKFNH